jgi:D-3-phosphoglycerate dehydrogenase / 2-oxoglutarate reductase
LSDDQFVLAENVASTAVGVFAHARPGSICRLSHAVGLQAAEQLRAIGTLGIRSRMKVKAALLDALPDLTAIDCFSVVSRHL